MSVVPSSAYLLPAVIRQIFLMLSMFFLHSKHLKKNPKS